MANGFILGVFELDLTPIGERKVQLPIRLGRSSLNDVPVSHRLVSEFHARIEEVDGQLCVRDLSSKNGVFVEAIGSDAPTRVDAQRPIELEPYGFEFLLSPLLRVRVRPDAEDAPVERLSHARGSVLGNAGLLASAASALSEDQVTAFHVPESSGHPAPRPATPAALRPATPAALRPATPAALRPATPAPATPAPAAPVLAAPQPTAPAPITGRPSAQPSPAAPRPAAPGPTSVRPPLVTAFSAGSPPAAASPAAQAYASMFVEGTSGPLELPPVPASAGRPAPLPPLVAEAGQTRLSHPPQARFRTVLEPAAAAEAVAPRLAQTAWEMPVGTQAAGRVAAPAPQPSGLAATSLEALALRGLRELAGSLIPGQPVESAGDVIQLITKLHDAVEMFCRCFIPVREACSRFIPVPELEQAAMERCRYRSSAYLAIEQALEPRAVAAALIDWRNDAQDAPAAVENILADLMLHHLALSQGVIEGTRALLEELSPTRLEAETAQQPSVLSRLGLASARERALWDAYAERHARLEAAGDAFRDIFGAEFTRAFEAHFQRRTS